MITIDIAIPAVAVRIPLLVSFRNLAKKLGEKQFKEVKHGKQKEYGKQKE